MGLAVTIRIPSGYQLRALAPADAHRVGRHRAAMYRAMGQLDESEMDQMALLTEPVAREALSGGAYFGFGVFALDAADRDLGGGGVLLAARWPSPAAGRVEPQIEGTIMNVFIDPEHQRQGIARALMQALESEAASRGVARLRLYASERGRHLYEMLGYAPTNELRLPGPPRR